VLPDVWFAYGELPDEAHDLLLVPHVPSNPAALASALADTLGLDRSRRAGLAYNDSYVVARLTFDELLRGALPLSRWWHETLWPPRARNLGAWAETHLEQLEMQLAPEDESKRRSRPEAELAWLVGLIGRISLGDEDSPADVHIGGHPGPFEPDPPVTLRRALALRGSQLISGVARDRERARDPLLWSVSLNRRARTALWRSTLAVKADAAQRVFHTTCAGLRWAVLDTGIDATHPAFRRRDANGALAKDPLAGPPPGAGTRVLATWDFTRLRAIVAGEAPAAGNLPKHVRDDLQAIESRLLSGRAIDWDAIEPLLRVHHDGDYRPPSHEHGTHVAGILGADWRTDDPAMPADHDLIGVCRDIELYDLRVLDDAGRGDEYAITAALQFVRHLNAHSDVQVIQGANLSFSLDHDVANYAVGRTPVCDECSRLTASGVCVVAAAGNEGRADYSTQAGVTEGYRTVSITDPGNAEAVITVGATHRYEPHTYGVSYFSSRGPTGDGRAKPDLVAPGEKINSPVPRADYKAKDGTSQATPHVSGAAALLMARYEELRGEPQRVKEILCQAATDLGRERYFQGAGMLDILRAMQAV
jgi:hypothetical protein